ncbi:MAG: tryptophan-rich sensory protein, partial [Clostridia bacterium]|nr:tryptophan-rich sensory protein [Clostridia bacterium]
MLKALKPYIISILISLGVGGLSAFLTRNNMNIYSEVTMPPPELPSILFPIVWTVLYILMGIGAAMVYTTPQVPSKKKAALTVYGISLGVNFLWNIIFFN